MPVISDPESLSTPGSTSSDETDSTGELLADRRRRAVLRYLADRDEAASLGDLADHVTLEEADRERGTIAEWGDALLGARRRHQLALRHVHLPMLADAGAVDFDAAANTAAIREAGTELLAREDGLEIEGPGTPQAELAGR